MFEPRFPIRLALPVLLTLGAAGCASGRDGPTAHSSSTAPTDVTGAISTGTPNGSDGASSVAAPGPCMIGATRCAGGSAFRCAVDGSRWVLQETCRPGKACVEPSAHCAPSEVAPVSGECTTPAEGTGKRVGDQLREMRWTDIAGGSVSTRDACGKQRAVLLVETAGWCVNCTIAAPVLQGLSTFYGGLGITVVVVVGEGVSGQPATATDAQKYAAVHGYGAPTSIVYDPGWQKATGAIDHGAATVTLPYMALIAGDMTLLYSGNNLSEVARLLNDLTGKFFEMQGKCAGHCGEKSAMGCHCDASCKKYDDCCSDFCDACGPCEK